MPYPVIAMPMWGGAGSRALDLSGRGNHFDDWSGGVSWVPEGLALEHILDGFITNNSPNMPAIGTGDYTLFVYQKKAANQTQGILAFGAYDPTWVISLSNHIYIYDGGNKTVSTGILTTGKAESFTFVREGTGANQTKYYINGLYDSATTHSDSIAAPSTMTIGCDRDSASNYEYSGTIYALHFFNVALTAVQVEFLNINPYFMYQIPEELYGYMDSGPPPETSIPALMNFYRQLRAG